MYHASLVKFMYWYWLSWLGNRSFLFNRSLNFHQYQPFWSMFRNLPHIAVPRYLPFHWGPQLETSSLHFCPNIHCYPRQIHSIFPKHRSWVSQPRLPAQSRQFSPCTHLWLFDLDMKNPHLLSLILCKMLIEIAKLSSKALLDCFGCWPHLQIFSFSLDLVFVGYRQNRISEGHFVAAQGCLQPISFLLLVLLYFVFLTFLSSIF